MSATSRVPHAAMGVPPQAGGGGDEYARLLQSRAAQQRRSRTMFGAVALLALGIGGLVWYRDYAKKGQQQSKLDFFERWAELDRRETGAFFNCVMASEVDMNLFSNAQQIQQRVESAYFTQQKTFSEHLTTDCVPKIERARQAMGGLKDAPEEFAPALAKYQDTLPKLQSGIEEYAEKIKDRKTVKDVDQLIQEHGGTWNGGGAPTPETIAYDKFLHCAIPGLAGMKDTQAMLEFLADACFKKDPVVFMDRVRKDCGPMLTNIDIKAKAPKDWKVTQKKFVEDEGRQFQAWESCAKKSRKGKKVEDLAAFLGTVGEYMENRTGVVKVARAIKDSAGAPGGSSAGAEKK